MSRVGKRPIEVPDDVDIEINDGTVTASGPEGEVTRHFDDVVTLELSDGQLKVDRQGEDRKQHSHQGLVRSRLSNMVDGVSKGFSRELEINGIGYRAAQRGRYIRFELGFSHPVLFELPDAVDVEIEDQTELKLKSADKELLGQVAAKIRDLRPPEPYKGKGIRFVGEEIRRKAGKTAGK